MDSRNLQQAVAELRPTLLRIARLQLRNDTWAEDAVSETLISALEAAAEAAQVETFDELFADDGHRLNRPRDWGDPEATYSRIQFFEVLQMCVEELPAALARVFMMREWLELDTAQICKEASVSSTNCFVMLHRARMRLRECLEQRWFAGEPTL
jgi:RNA polymerase sigma-70 factor (ECF subfamily)